MTQPERDRLVVLKKAKKQLITQKQAAKELGVSARQVRRLIGRLSASVSLVDQRLDSRHDGRAEERPARRPCARFRRSSLMLRFTPFSRIFLPGLAGSY